MGVSVSYGHITSFVLAEIPCVLFSIYITIFPFVIRQYNFIKKIIKKKLFESAKKKIKSRKT